MYNQATSFFNHTTAGGADGNGSIQALPIIQQVLTQLAAVGRTLFPTKAIHNLITIGRLILDKSNEAGRAVEMVDVFLLCVGYGTLFLVVFLAHSMAQIAARTELSRRAAAVVIEPIRALASVTKVGVLLFMRIFFLPMCLGACVMSTSNVLLQLPQSRWVDFVATNIVGSIALTWVLGITYMLTVTLSVLQLREVLHPDILAKSIRPQEPHLDLLSSLLNEPGGTHIRRICK